MILVSRTMFWCPRNQIASLILMVGLSVSLSICLSVHVCLSGLYLLLFVSLLVSLSASPSVYLSVHLPVYLSIHPTVCRSACLSIHLSLSQSVLVFYRFLLLTVTGNCSCLVYPFICNASEQAMQCKVVIQMFMMQMHDSSCWTHSFLEIQNSQS